MNEEYIQHLKDVDIPAWQSGRGDWFTIHLFRLFQKADSGNQYKLASVFPEEYEAFSWWNSGAWEESRET